MLMLSTGLVVNVVLRNLVRARLVELVVFMIFFVRFERRFPFVFKALVCSEDLADSNATEQFDL